MNVIIDLVDPPDKRLTLGDDFRVEARIITAQARGVLKAPTAAIFRHGQQSTVYVLSAGRAVMRPISLGRTGPLETEITDGLVEGDQVIVYPSDKVTDGRRAQLRPLR